MVDLDRICTGWETASTKERAVTCRAFQAIVKKVRPNEAISEMTTATLKVGHLADADMKNVQGFMLVVKKIREKMSQTEKEGFGPEDYICWGTRIEAICGLISMGIPTGLDLFSLRPEAARNQNSKLSSYLEHLRVKQPDECTKMRNMLEDAISERRNQEQLDLGQTNESRNMVLKVFEDGMEFSDSRIIGTGQDESTEGLFTGMANVDWLLLAAYHFMRAGFKLEDAIKTMKGIAQFSLVSPITWKRVGGLSAWEPFKTIAARCEKAASLYTCPMQLTPARLVNCSSLLFKGASDIYILRGEWTLMEIVNYVALQLEAAGGIDAISSQAGTTSNVEWMVHRLLMTGESGNPAVYVTNQKSPLMGAITVDIPDRE